MDMPIAWQAHVCCASYTIHSSFRGVSHGLSLPQLLMQAHNDTHSQLCQKPQSSVCSSKQSQRKKVWIFIKIMAASKTNFADVRASITLPVRNGSYLNVFHLL
eukprot:c15989_g3_i1 orf=603-911(+)